MAGKLWNLLKDRAKELETRKSHSMKERQEALMDAFASDMDYYRTHGKPDSMYRFLTKVAADVFTGSLIIDGGWGRWGGTGRD